MLIQLISLAHLDKFWKHQQLLDDFEAELTGIGAVDTELRTGSALLCTCVRYLL